jgi:hypothetical protein
MRRDLDKIRDGGLGASVSGGLGDLQSKIMHTRMNMARRVKCRRRTREDYEI